MIEKFYGILIKSKTLEARSIILILPKVFVSDISILHGVWFSDTDDFNRCWYLISRKFVNINENVSTLVSIMTEHKMPDKMNFPSTSNGIHRNLKFIIHLRSIYTKMFRYQFRKPSLAYLTMSIWYINSIRFVMKCARCFPKDKASKISKWHSRESIFEAFWHKILSKH